MTTLNVLLIDNFDSFSFNLVDELEKRKAQVHICRNGVRPERALEMILEAAPPRLLVLSPGPGMPKNAGCCVELVRQAAGQVPIFGVCLGHQAIVEAYGGVVRFAGEVVHGKAAQIEHDQKGIWSDLPSPMRAARYHSLAAVEVRAPLRVSATAHSVVMAVEHATLPIFGVQFHPESILTPEGGRFIDAVMRWACTYDDTAKDAAKDAAKPATPDQPNRSPETA